MYKMRAYCMGADEAGRAPLAGPVSVGVVLVPAQFDVKREFPGVKDSKKLSLLQREKIYELAKARARAGDIQFCVRFSSHTYIDEHGITQAVRKALWDGVKKLAPHPTGVHVYLDGLLHAPPEYAQETIVRGDALVPIISLASIMAKVERDRLMQKLAKKYPMYRFERHMGYATREHREAIKKFGMCDLHRKTYCHF